MQLFFFALVWHFSYCFHCFFEFYWNLMFKNSHLTSKERHKITDASSRSLYSTHIRRWNLLMSDRRAQDDSVMKTFPTTSTTTGSGSSYIKTLFFSQPLYVTLPHPRLKPAPKKQTKKWGRGKVIKMERRYQVK